MISFSYLIKLQVILCLLAPLILNQSKNFQEAEKKFIYDSPQLQQFGNQKPTSSPSVSINYIRIQDHIFEDSRLLQASFLNNNQFNLFNNMALDQIVDTIRTNNPSLASRIPLTEAVPSIIQKPVNQNNKVNNQNNVNISRQPQYQIRASTLTTGIRTPVLPVNPAQTKNDIQNIADSQGSFLRESLRGPIINQAAPLVGRANISLSRPNITSPQVVRNIQNLSEPTLQQQLNKVSQQQVLKKAKSITLGLSNLSQFSDIFQKSLSAEQIQNMILTADYLPIVYRIQQVLGSNKNCEQKISLLSDDYGKIMTGVAIKNNQNNETRLIFINMQNQIRKYTEQIMKIQRRLVEIKTDIQSDRYFESTLSVSRSFDIKNSASKEETQKSLIVNQIQSDLADLRNKNDQARKQLSLQMFKQSQLNINIGRLTMAQLQTQQIIQRQKIRNLNDTIRKNNQSIAKLEKDRSVFRQSVERIQTETDQRLVDQKQRIAEAEKQREIRNKYQQEVSQYRKILKNLNISKNILESQLNAITAQPILQITQSLFKLKPLIKQRIDTQNYACNGVRKPEVLKFAGQISFIIGVKDFVTYLKQSYNQTIDLFSLPPFKVQLFAITIQDEVWNRTYGSPYTKESIKSIQNLVYKQDFSCTEPERLETGSGTVFAINRKSIIVATNNGFRNILKLSACSRIESADKIPRVNQRVVFRGRKVGELEYNLYKATFF